MLDKNPDNVKIVFKHLPLRMHRFAEQAALAAIAAQNQGKFWQMHDALFETAKLSKEAIEQAAQKIGLDMDRFKKDMNSQESRQKLARDMLDAQKAEIGGTPTLFINGHLVKNRSPEAIQKMIDAELQKTSTGKKGG